MDSMLMIYPMFGLYVLTLIVFVSLFRARAGAVTRGEIRPTHYLTYSDGQSETRFVAARSRHFSNLFETPVLFYVVCLGIMLANATNVALIALAWGYVGARVVHAVIHLGSNHLRWRIGVYFGSWVFLTALWFGLVVCVARA